MDLCGFPKDNYYYYKSWWGAEPVLHLFPHWNWPASKVGEEISVWCHTNLESVELFLNGASQGTKTVARNTHVEWKVKYQPGEIEVRGSKAGKVALTSKRETVDAPAKIVLTADRTTLASDGEDVSMIRIEVQDAKGRLIPIADNEITFEVVGQGRLLGLGNGDPSSHELEGAHQRRVFNGLGQAIVQARRQAGAISLYATSAGLETGRLELTVERQQPRPAI
jgi:beta-galactosidase